MIQVGKYKLATHTFKVADTDQKIELSKECHFEDRTNLTFDFHVFILINLKRKRMMFVGWLTDGEFKKYKDNIPISDLQTIEKLLQILKRNSDNFIRKIKNDTYK